MLAGMTRQDRIGQTTWCPECRTSRTIEDDFTESTYAPDGEHEFRVLSLDCGHDVQYGDRVVGAAPGAPYAGPGVAVAASTRLRDLEAAGDRQDALDHPYGREWDA